MRHACAALMLCHCKHLSLGVTVPGAAISCTNGETVRQRPQRSLPA